MYASPWVGPAIQFSDNVFTARLLRFRVHLPAGTWRPVPAMTPGVRMERGCFYLWAA